MEELVEKWGSLLKGLGFPEERMGFVASFAEHLVDKFTNVVATTGNLNANYAATNLLILSRLNLEGKICLIEENTRTTGIKIKYPAMDLVNMHSAFGIDVSSYFDSILVNEMVEQINKELETCSTLVIDCFVTDIKWDEPDGQFATCQVLGRYNTI